MSSLEDRLQRMEDLMEIHQLFIDYGMHLDAGRFEEYSNLFATDGQIRLGPLGKAQGREAIRETMIRALDGLVGKTYHVISSPSVQLNGDTATSEVMWTMIERGDDGQPRLAMLGRHRDELVREDGRWKISVRRGLIDVPNRYPGV
jgi:ketosteroid isomerase-like protein